MKRRKKTLSPRTIAAAKLVAGGMRQADAAKELGIGQQTVSRAVRAVLNYEQFEDIRNCRLIAERRLDQLRNHLLGLCGLVDNDIGGKPPTAKKDRVEAKGHARIARVLIDIEKRRAEMFGFDAPQHVVTHEADPLESMSPEEVLASCESLHIPVPPGLRTEVARRAKRSAQSPESPESGKT